MHSIKMAVMSIKKKLVEIGKQLSNLTQLVMVMMEKINKNTSDEIIDKSSRPRNFNRNNFYSRDQCFL